MALAAHSLARLIDGAVVRHDQMGVLADAEQASSVEIAARPQRIDLADQAAGSITMPLPMTQTLPGWSTPDGTRWRTVFSPFTTSVCPALLPPW